MKDFVKDCSTILFRSFFFSYFRYDFLFFFFNRLLLFNNIIFPLSLASLHLFRLSISNPAGEMSGVLIK